MWQGTEEQATEGLACFFVAVASHLLGPFWGQPPLRWWSKEKNVLPIYSSPVDKPTKFQHAYKLHDLTVSLL